MVGENFEIPRCEIAEIDGTKYQEEEEIYVVEISKSRLGAKKQTKSLLSRPTSSNTDYFTGAVGRQKW